MKNHNDENHGSKKRRGASEGRKRYSLFLYITGNTPRSLRSIERLRELCEKYLKDRYELKVVDICQQPELASESQILAAPTLIKKYPPPLLRLIGDLSDHHRVKIALGLEAI